jgi:chloride channel protein, CIC family
VQSKSASFRSRFTQLLDRIQPSETAITFATAIAIGAGTGLAAVLFIRLIELIQQFSFETIAASLSFLGRGVFILIPALGGLIAGPVIAFFASEAKGHGVPEVMQAIAVEGGRIRPRVVIAKVIASSLCIGSGGSAGREGPIVQVGAALGSALGQWVNFSPGRIRNLVACGAAAGIAATFNAPIAGVIFTVEIILGELQLGDIGSVVISAMTSATLARVFLGDRPSFVIPNYSVKTPWEILLYIPLGILAALAAVAFIRLLYWFEDQFDNWKFPDALKPGVGGLLLGLMAFFYPMVLGLGFVPEEEALLGVPIAANIPHVLGSGFPVIEDALLGQVSLILLLVLVVLKPLATSLTLGSGNSGGVFAPALFMGAALGAAFGNIVDQIAPGLTAGPGIFAVVGMAAVFAGAARAPFTAILIVVEMTNDYRVIIPLMAGVVVSVVVAERLHKESIYTLKLVKRGIPLRRGRDIDVMEAVSVREVMISQPITVPVNMPAALLGSEFVRTGRHGFAVINPDGSLFGIVSLEDYRHLTMSQEAAESLIVGDIATRDIVTVFPDETVGVALRRMAPRDLSRLPVVSRENASQLVGVVRRNDIVRAYEVGLVRREEARRRADTVNVVRTTHAEFLDIPITSHSAAAGKTVAEIKLQRAAVLVSIRRGDELIIPHGDTSLMAGDVVTALCERAHVSEVRDALT